MDTERSACVADALTALMTAEGGRFQWFFAISQSTLCVSIAATSFWSHNHLLVQFKDQNCKGYIHEHRHRSDDKDSFTPSPKKYFPASV